MCKVWLDKFPNSVVGITPLVTFPTAVHMLEVVRNLPLTRLVLETDAPYFLPKGGGRHGFLGNGTRDFSLPVDVVNVAAQIAVIKGCKIGEVINASRMNIRRVYCV